MDREKHNHIHTEKHSETDLKYYTLLMLCCKQKFVQQKL